MVDSLAAAWAVPTWLVKAGLIASFYLVAWLIHRLSDRLAGRFVQLNRFAPRTQRLRPERQNTLRGLIGSAFSAFAVILATLASLALFVATDTLVWMVGLFSAAFGLGARPLVNDLLTGMSFIFDDTYDVGEKISVLEVEGVVEAVNLRTTLLRAPSGELYVVPNGDIRVIRNFSRGRFSMAQIKVQLAGADLARALPLLQELGVEAVSLLPNLLEPWQVINESGAIGQTTELTLIAKARFGTGAEMRPRLLALLQERLSAADIALTS